MSVIPSDLVAYGSANMPEADGVAVGGAVDFSRRVAFYDITPAGTIDFVSSSATDTGVKIQVAGRDSTGVIQTPAAVTLNGTTVVTGSQSFERLLYGVVSGASPTGPLTDPGGSNANTNASMTISSTTVSFASAPAGFPVSGNYYVAVDSGANFEIMLVTAGQGTASLTVTRYASGPNLSGLTHASGVNVKLMPGGDVAAIAHTATISGHTAQTGSANHSGTTPPLMKLQSGDGASVSAGQIIRITSGTGAGQIRMIIATSGYGTDIVAVNRDWNSGATPDNTSVYNVNQGILFETGFASSGTNYGDPNPVTSVVRAFSTSAADVPTGSARYFYEKVFVVNNNTATALTGAQVEIASETPSLPTGALLDIGLTTALNDTNTCNPRQQASSFLPSGVSSFTTQPAFINVPSPGNLPSGTAPNAAGAQGVWMRLTLPAGAAAYKGSADLRTQGTTT
jgi:hypothetical protein